MPWTAKDATRHTHKASTPAKQEKWARVSTGILKKTGDEGKAIRIANSMMADGGMIEPESGWMSRQPVRGMKPPKLHCAADGDVIGPLTPEEAAQEEEQRRRRMAMLGQMPPPTLEPPDVPQQPPVLQRYGGNMPPPVLPQDMPAKPEMPPPSLEGPATQHYKNVASDYENRIAKPGGGVPAWRQVVGAALSISPHLRGIASEVGGQAGLERQRQRVGLSLQQANEEQQLRREGSMEQMRRQQMEDTSAWRRTSEEQTGIMRDTQRQQALTDAVREGNFSSLKPWQEAPEGRLETTIAGQRGYYGPRRPVVQNTPYGLATVDENGNVKYLPPPPELVTQKDESTSRRNAATLDAINAKLPPDKQISPDSPEGRSILANGRLPMPQRQSAPGKPNASLQRLELDQQTAKAVEDLRARYGDQAAQHLDEIPDPTTRFRARRALEQKKGGLDPAALAQALGVQLPGAGAPKAPAQKSPQPAQQSFPFTEQQVRDRAKQQGRDENVAVQLARQNKMIQ